MNLLDQLNKSISRPYYYQLEKAEQDLQSSSKLKSGLAAVNMGFYPFESKEQILEKVKTRKTELETEFPSFKSEGEVA